jgi:predicted SAM-dependent methyltransferase
LLNRAARYFPILREVDRYAKSGDSLLEVGSGSLGLGEFSLRRFVGCDRTFAERPRPPMSPVAGSGLQLPFADHSFDLVIASDVLEHIPPAGRRSFIFEALRVMRKAAIFAFPSGPLAFDADRRLSILYDRSEQDWPEWLKEHMLYPFPDADLFEGLPDHWAVTSFANEDLRFHSWMMRREMNSRWNRLFCFLIANAPVLVKWLLSLADREPCYRRIFVVTCAKGCVS